MNTDNYGNLVEELKLVDGLVPLALTDEEFLMEFEEAGFYAVHATTFVASSRYGENDFRNAISNIKQIQASISELENIYQVDSFSDLESNDGLGVIFGFQGTRPIEKDPNNVSIFKQLGVKIMQLTYNSRNLSGNGCTERSDDGLSHFGLDLIDAIENNNVILDLSHAGPQTTIEALNNVNQPTIISHSNPNAVFDNARNVSDQAIKAVAETDGVVGVNPLPSMVAENPTVSDLVDHVEYLRELVGPEHIGIGLDLVENADNITLDRYNTLLDDDPEFPDAPFSYTEGIQTPAEITNLVQELDDRGFSEDELRSILGGNFLRVYRTVWQE